MAVIIFWIENGKTGRIGIMPRPRGGDWLEDDICSLHASGAEVVVSLLEKEEITELDLGKEQEVCESRGLEYISFPIPDGSVPQSKQDMARLVDVLGELSSKGRHIVVHCRQGIGRSSMIAAGILTSLGMTVEEAFERITKARGRPVPDTREQREWVAEFVSGRFRVI